MSMTLREAILAAERGGLVCKDNANEVWDTTDLLFDLHVAGVLGQEVVYDGEKIVAVGSDGYLVSGEPLYRCVLPEGSN